VRLTKAVISNDLNAKIKSLVVVESPAKARTIARFLGPNFEVMASLGHVRDLPSGDLGVSIPDKFTPKYVVPKTKRKVVQDLKKSSKNVEQIYLATDPDREGEAISWHLVNAAGWENIPIQRVVFHQITDEAVQEAFAHPRDIDMRLVNAQQARRILDRLVGYQLSPLLWKKIQKGLSAGRVQSIALKIVVDREKEIDVFIPKEYWYLEATLSKSDSNSKDGTKPFIARLQSVKGNKVPLEIKSGVQVSELLEGLNGVKYQVSDVHKKEARSKPSPPFITSTLQQEAWRKLRFSANKTMRVAQQLYEGLSIGTEGPTGLITYMRTDSVEVAPEAIRSAVSYIKEHFGDEYVPKSPRKFSKKAKGAQEAHEAVRPSEVTRIPDSIRKDLNSDQFRLYELVWKRMVSSQMADAIYDSTRIDIDASGSDLKESYVFRTTGSVMKFPGYRALYLEDIDDPSDEDGQQSSIPDLYKGDNLNCSSLDSTQHFTKAPPRYNEASLIKKLEEEGIGRPSTYAPTLSTILDRNYVEKEQGRFNPTVLGKVVSEQLVNHFPDIMDIGFTAEMEHSLDEIARGEREWVPVLEEFYGPFKEALDNAVEDMPRVKVEEPTDETCEMCSKPMVIKTGRYGKFVACTGFPECRGTKQIKKPPLAKCPECEPGELVERRGKGRAFYGCTNYPNCTFTSLQMPVSESCPSCQGLLVVSKKDQTKCIKCGFEGSIELQEAEKADK
jgi:DNA topoisomerase-1